MGVLAAFDEYLRRARGVSPGTRRNYAKYVGEFLAEVFLDGGVEFAEVRAPEVDAFVGALSGRYRPRTVEHAASALRSFFRFMRAQRWCEDRLADAVPMVPHRRSGLVRHLDPRVLEQLIASLESASARDLRDRAIILTIARLGLRPGEVLRLEDLEWRNAAVRVPARKTGHGALLPLTSEVGAALACTWPFCIETSIVPVASHALDAWKSLLLMVKAPDEPQPDTAAKTPTNSRTARRLLIPSPPSDLDTFVQRRVGNAT